MAINYNEEELGLQLPNTNQGIMEVADLYNTPDGSIPYWGPEQYNYNEGMLNTPSNPETLNFTEAVNEYGYPLMASLSGSIPNKVSALDQMANYDWSGFDNNIAKNMALAKQMNTTLDNTIGEESVDPWTSFYGNPELYQGFVERGEPLAGEPQYRIRDQLKRDFLQGGLFRDAKQSLGQTKDAFLEDVGGMQEGLGYLKNKAGQGWDFAKQLPGMAMSALTGLPGIGMAMGLLRNMARPDSPYQAFQKQTFKDMGWQGESNKDPWGKNIRSLKDNYDVTEQWGDLMGTKIGEKYGYADAFADGVLDDAELAKMQELGLKGWQLNRAIGLSTAAKKAQDWKDKRAAEKIITNKMKNIDTSGGKTPTYTPTGNYGKKQGTTGSWTPGGSYQGAKSSPKGYSARSHSGGNYGGQHHWARGGRVGYANGGLASLFTRRG